VRQALLIARNPDPESSLPNIVLIPLGSGIVLRTRESVPVVFAENRALAQEWTYRFLAAAVQERLLGDEARRILPDSPPDTTG